MTQDQIDLPLTEDELDTLSDFLTSDRVPDTTLSLEGVDGLMCALQIGPKRPGPSEWLPVIWGVEKGPAYNVAPSDEPMLTLLMRHWNSIAYAFSQAQTDPEEGYWPIMYLPEDGTPDDAIDTEYGHEWAVGFRLGMDFNSDFWDVVLKDESLSGGLVPIVLLDLGMHPEAPERVIDYGIRQELVGDLIPALHQFWRLAREGALTTH